MKKYLIKIILLITFDPNISPIEKVSKKTGLINFERLQILHFFNFCANPNSHF
jgi:hypothetical protein